MQAVVMKLILLLVILSGAGCSVCNSWFHRVNWGNGSLCACRGLASRTVNCRSDWRVGVLIGHGMTHDDNSKETATGACPFINSNSAPENGFELQPSYLEDLTNFSCGQSQRCGKLCSHCCNSSYGISVLSVKYDCVPCHNSYSVPALIGAVIIPGTI